MPRGANAKREREYEEVNYQHLAISQIAGTLNGLSQGDLRKIENYEKSHKNWKGAFAEIDKQMKG